MPESVIFYRIIGFALSLFFVLFTPLKTLAQSDFWTGTWNATYAELRLKQSGDFVYGDYGERGVIEGVLVNTARGDALRARFTRNDGVIGYMEWVESGDDGNRFTGRWVFEDAAMPEWDDQSLTRWRGTRIQDDSPTLTQYKGNAQKNSMVAGSSSEYRRWVNAQDMDAADPWTGTWDTPYGPVRLRNFAGRYVYGDYGNVGSIWGVQQKVGNNYILRARFRRNDDGKEGYVEWQSDGKADHTITGRWRWDSQSLPTWNGTDGGNWASTRINAARPTLANYTGSYGQQAYDAMPQKMKDWVKFEPPKKEDAQSGTDIDWSTPQRFTMPYRDLGTIIHHTRFPFLVSPSYFRELVHADKNFTKNVRGGSGQLRAAPLYMATSLGDSYDHTSSERLPADVLMGVYEHKVGQDTKSYCLISYRGTDRDHKYLGRLNDGFGPLGEGGISMAMRSADLDPSSAECTVKQGYKVNYEETKTAVHKFLNDATSASHCQSGIVVTGMSLGGATASIAGADLSFIQSGNLNANVKALTDAGKLHVITAGAPRALTGQCRNRMPKRLTDKTKRFVYGSAVMHKQVGDSLTCPRFMDPVTGNPPAVRSGADLMAMKHYGTPILGFVPGPLGYDPRTDKRTCGVMDNIRCRSIHWANDVSRSASQRVQIDPVTDENLGGSCSGADLIPTREALFGRLHDTCSYRNLMASYGTKMGEFPNATNYQCRFVSNPSDPSNYPDSPRVRGSKVTPTESGPI